MFSFNIWADVRPLGILSAFQDMTIFDSVEYVVTGIFLPIGALLVCAFAGWFIAEKTRTNEYGEGGLFYQLWRILVRFIVPAGMTLVFIF